MPKRPEGSRRTVDVKGTYGLAEVGLGSVPARLLWESDPDETGAFASLARDTAGRCWLNVTDMEEPDGSYVSVPVTPADLARLRTRLMEGINAEGA